MGKRTTCVALSHSTARSGAGASDVKVFTRVWGGGRRGRCVCVCGGGLRRAGCGGGVVGAGGGQEGGRRAREAFARRFDQPCLVTAGTCKPCRPVTSRGQGVEIGRGETWLAVT